MLCGRHFKYSDFYDSEKRKLSIFAIPSVSGEQESVAVMTNKENKFDEVCISENLSTYLFIQ